MDRLNRFARKQSETEIPRLGERIACSQRMKEAVQQWSEMYENNAPWTDGTKVKGLNLLPAIASEVARLATLELRWSVDGSPRAQFLEQQIAPVRQRLRQFLEYAVGKGGLVMKP